MSLIIIPLHIAPFDALSLLRSQNSTDEIEFHQIKKGLQNSLTKLDRIDSGPKISEYKISHRTQNVYNFTK